MVLERLRRARDWVEEKIDNERQRTREWREPRHRDVEDKARREYYEELDYARERQLYHGASPELSRKRVLRAEKRYKKNRVPVENRVAKKLVGATRDVADVAFAPKYSRHHDRIAAGRKRAYDIVRGSARSYNENVPKSFKKSRQTKQFGNFLLTGSSSSSPKASGWGIMYGPSGSRGGGGGRGRRGRKEKSSGSDPFWML